MTWTNKTLGFKGGDRKLLKSEQKHPKVKIRKTDVQREKLGNKLHQKNNKLWSIKKFTGFKQRSCIWQMNWTRSVQKQIQNLPLLPRDPQTTQPSLDLQPSCYTLTLPFSISVMDPAALPSSPTTSAWCCCPSPSIRSHGKAQLEKLTQTASALFKPAMWYSPAPLHTEADQDPNCSPLVKKTNNLEVQEPKF